MEHNTISNRDHAQSHGTFATTSTPQADYAQPKQDRLGTILKRVREHRGEDIHDIAEYLCIRVAYLIALENSEYEKLPADAYVIGFLKSYAGYLELDDKGAVNQYRHEMAGRRRKPQLSMPQPMSESRAPTLALLGGAIVAVLLVYGIWYWLWVPDTSVIKEEPLLPLEQGEVLPPPTTPDEAKDPLISNPTESETKNEPAPESTTEGDQAEKVSVPLNTALSTIVIEAKEEDAVDVIDTNKQEKLVKKEGEEPETEILVNGKKVEAAPKKQAEPQPQAAPEKQAEPKPQVILEKQPESILPAEPIKPQIYGTTGRSDTTILAEQDAWVLITDTKGLTVFDRTLKAGESYRVPIYQGLHLTTGNPKDLLFTIHGRNMPRLRTMGAVARGVPLDTNKLQDILRGDH